MSIFICTFKYYQGTLGAILYYCWNPSGVPGDSVVKNLPARADVGLIPGSGRSPGEGKWQPTPVFLLGKSDGQRSLVGYSPWGHKESDTTKWLYLQKDYICMCVCSVLSASFAVPQTVAHSSVHRIPRQNGVGGHFLLQGLFSIQESDRRLLGLLHWQADSLSLVSPQIGKHCRK